MKRRLCFRNAYALFVSGILATLQPPLCKLGRESCREEKPANTESEI